MFNSYTVNELWTSNYEWKLKFYFEVIKTFFMWKHLFDMKLKNPTWIMLSDYLYDLDLWIKSWRQAKMENPVQPCTQQKNDICFL